MEQLTRGNESETRRSRKYSSDVDPVRNRFEQDRDRILYSAGFRRLAGITQIAAASEVTLLHNRLTHSLKVAQVGRRLTQRLLQDYPTLSSELALDADVVETAGLAHDLGHPPFGHVAERILDDKLREAKAGGFEGNAQTLRYVAKTAIRRTEEADPGSGALDLTRASLNALIKYPWCEHDERGGDTPKWIDRLSCPPSKWNAYEIDREVFTWIRVDSQSGVRCPEAAIMDWADDVSYAIHDFEDYVRARLIPAHTIHRDIRAFADYSWKKLSERYSKAEFDKPKFDEAIDRIKAWNFDDPYGGSRSDEANLNKWVSARITECLEGDAVELDSQPPRVRVNEKRQYLVEVLKQLPMFYVIDWPPFAAAQQGQCRVIASLFDSLKNMVGTRRSSVPRTLHEILVSIEKETSVAAERRHNEDFVSARATVDYLCTLTEVQAFELHDRFSGSSPSMFHGPWL